MTCALRILPILLLALAASGCNNPSKGTSARLLAGNASTAGGVTAGTTAGTTGAGTPTPSPAPTPTPGAPAPGNAPVTPATPTTGSRFWYDGDAFGSPFKTHNAGEASFAQQVLTLVNAERAAAGLPALLQDPQAELAAKVHSEDMEGRNFFAHNTPEGWTPGDRLQMTGASGYLANGENVAFGQQTPAEVMTAWMNSPGHRANILYPSFTHMGVGVAEGRPYWTQVFLTR